MHSFICLQFPSPLQISVPISVPKNKVLERSTLQYLVLENWNFSSIFASTLNFGQSWQNFSYCGRLKKYMFVEFPLAPMGVLGPGAGHARPSAQPPINTSRNLPAPVSAYTVSPIRVMG